MASPADASQRIEIRDAAGRQPSSDTGDQPDWQSRYQELAAEHNKLQKEVADLRAEIQQYKQALYALLPLPDPMTEDELREIERDGVTFEQIFEDIEKIQGS